jgi:hypothetical protein
LHEKSRLAPIVSDNKRSDSGIAVGISGSAVVITALTGSGIALVGIVTDLIRSVTEPGTVELGLGISISRISVSISDLGASASGIGATLYIPAGV